jgi:hypothetical protein
VIANHCLRLQKSKTKARRLIAASNPQLVVITGNTILEPGLVVSEAARRGAKVMLLDVYGALPAVWRAIHRDRTLGQRVAVSTFGRRVLATLFPHWTYRFDDGRRILFDTPEFCIAARLCGIMPKNPFARGVGPIAALTAINEYSRRTLESFGCLPERIHLIGRLQDDAAFSLIAKASSNRTACLVSLGLDPSRPLIICSSAPFVEHKMMTVEEQRQYHETMMSELAAIKGAQVAISLHPGQRDRTDVYEIALRHGVRVFDAPGINELMPLAALYVDGESTVAIVAAACAVPMIAVHFDRQIFPDGAPPPERREPLFREYVASLRPPERLITDGMDFADGWKHAATLARRCLSDRAYYARLVEGQRQSARLWAPAFDGKAIERAVGLVDRLAFGTRAPD